MWAAILILLIYTLNLGYVLAKHNEPKNGKYNFWVELISTFIELSIFYCAGTFDKLL